MGHTNSTHHAQSLKSIVRAMRLVALFAALACFAGPAMAEDRVKLPPRQITEADKAAIRETIKRQLKDPESARFRWVAYTGLDELYCGFVNAKNSYGGYVGFKPFAVMLATNNMGKQVALPFDMDTEERTAQFCRSYSVPLSAPATDDTPA